MSVLSNYQAARDLAHEILGGFKVGNQTSVPQLKNYFTHDPGAPIELYEVNFSEAESFVLAVHVSKGCIHVFIISGTIKKLLATVPEVKTLICTFELNVRRGNLSVKGELGEIRYESFSSETFSLFEQVQRVLFRRKCKVRLLQQRMQHA